VINRKKRIYPLLALACCLVFNHCKPTAEYDGDSVLNYPDVNMILDENLKPYQKEPYTFKIIHIEGERKDSVFQKASDIDWAEWEAPFRKANLFQNKLDKHYDIDVINDTVYGKMTLILTALDPKDITTKMNIQARLSDNEIMSLYAEVRDAGFFTTTEYKLLFVNKQSLQIQEVKKTPFSGVKQHIRTLYFLN
jgi:hypothetical protein